MRYIHIPFEASNCSILTCEENEECVQVNDIFKCACKPDYEGPDCELGKHVIFVPSQKFL
jgi:hypothetical protein